MAGAGSQGRRAAYRPPAHRTDQVPRRRWPWVLLGLVVLLVAWVAWLAVDLRTARTELLAAADAVGYLKADVLAGDDASAEESLAAFQAHASAAAEATTGPHWDLAVRVPVLGPNMEAVRTVAGVIEELAGGPVVTLLDATSLVDPTALAPVEGRVDLAPLVAAAPAVVRADEAVHDAAARLDAVPREDLWPVVDDAFGRAVDQVADLRSSTATAARAVQLLPPMLGADGPRDYLLLVQNSAELRATGGIPGSVLLLHAEDGAVTLTDHRSGASLGDLPAPVLELTEAELALFGEDLAADMRDVGFTPDFPRSAEIARAIWQQEVGTDVDGVLATDPAALAQILRATGPVALPRGPVSAVAGSVLTSDNAVDVLLRAVYAAMPDPAQHDEFFAATAGSVLGALLGGGAEPAALVDALAVSARQGRLLVWSADPAEQGLLAGTVLAGELRGNAGESPVIGVFLNDGTAAKMDYYLSVDVVAEPTCLPGGAREVALSVTLTNTLAPDAVAGLPPYVTGSLATPGEVRTNVLVYAPTGGAVLDVEVPGQDPGVLAQVHDGLAMVGRTTALGPGESVTLEATIGVPADVPGPVLIRTSPFSRTSGNAEVPRTCS